jgi:hypothetical protein
VCTLLLPFPTSQVRALLRIVASERAADAASPEFIAEAIGSLGSRGLLDPEDADAVVGYIASGAGRGDPVMESLSQALVNFQADGDVEQVRSLS